jgi:hypothetical protein
MRFGSTAGLLVKYKVAVAGKSIFAWSRNFVKSSLNKPVDAVSGDAFEGAPLPFSKYKKLKNSDFWVKFLLPATNLVPFIGREEVSNVYVLHLSI